MSQEAGAYLTTLFNGGAFFDITNCDTKILTGRNLRPPIFIDKPPRFSYIDTADFEELEKQGNTAIENWINKQLNGTSVTVVLVGEKTCSSRWVKYEIEKSIEIGNGLLGIDISKIKDLQENTSERCGQIPKGYDFHLWFKGDGYNNMGDWIESAAKDAGR